MLSLVALFHFSCIMVSHARKIFWTCCGKFWPKKIKQVYVIICMYARKGVGPFVIHGFKTMCNYILAFARLCTLVNFHLKAGCGIKLRQDILFKLPLSRWWRINYKRKSLRGEFKGYIKYDQNPPTLTIMIYAHYPNQVVKFTINMTCVLFLIVLQMAYFWSLLWWNYRWA